MATPYGMLPKGLHIRGSEPYTSALARCAQGVQADSKVAFAVVASTLFKHVTIGDNSEYRFFYDADYVAVGGTYERGIANVYKRVMVQLDQQQQQPQPQAQAQQDQRTLNRPWSDVLVVEEVEGGQDVPSSAGPSSAAAAAVTPPPKAPAAAASSRATAAAPRAASVGRGGPSGGTPAAAGGGDVVAMPPPPQQSRKRPASPAGCTPPAAAAEPLAAAAAASGQGRGVASAAAGTSSGVAGAPPSTSDSPAPAKQTPPLKNKVAGAAPAGGSSAAVARAVPVRGIATAAAAGAPPSASVVKRLRIAPPRAAAPAAGGPPGAGAAAVGVKAAAVANAKTTAAASAPAAQAQAPPAPLAAEPVAAAVTQAEAAELYLRTWMRRLQVQLKFGTSHVSAMAQDATSTRKVQDLTALRHEVKAFAAQLLSVTTIEAMQDMFTRVMAPMRELELELHADGVDTTSLSVSVSQFVDKVDAQQSAELREIDAAIRALCKDDNPFCKLVSFSNADTAAFLGFVHQGCRPPLQGEMPLFRLRAAASTAATAQLKRLSHIKVTAFAAVDALALQVGDGDDTVRRQLALRVGEQNAAMDAETALLRALDADVREAIQYALTHSDFPPIFKAWVHSLATTTCCVAFCHAHKKEALVQLLRAMPDHVAPRGVIIINVDPPDRPLLGRIAADVMGPGGGAAGGVWEQTKKGLLGSARAQCILLEEAFKLPDLQDVLDAEGVPTDPFLQTALVMALRQWSVRHPEARPVLRMPPLPPVSTSGEGSSAGGSARDMAGVLQLLMPDALTPSEQVLPQTIMLSTTRAVSPAGYYASHLSTVVYTSFSTRQPPQQQDAGPSGSTPMEVDQQLVATMCFPGTEMWVRGTQAGDPPASVEFTSVDTGLAVVP